MGVHHKAIDRIRHELTLAGDIDDHLARALGCGHDEEKSSHICRSLVMMDHVESLVAAAQAGCGIIRQMSLTLAPALQEGRLLPVLSEWQAAGPDIVALCQPTCRETAQVKVFIEFLHEIFIS
ncbi:LysR substrate-binding domain-containing protein [Herbaspirillum sp.]|uniref:LysR substrate-binding domain-containing protein n=1 Tax=Herbaspirillum sp. TaxID=1890675 RepID=UPI002D779AF1|nr:LysR substrate-binding domain-containing protein [Herbaspirillum sp.]